MRVEGVVAKDSAVYPRGLCGAMLRGVADQLGGDSLVKTGCFGIQVPGDDAAVEREIRVPAKGFSGRFRDDLTGQVLNDALVIKAREVELSFFHSKGVWTKRPKSHARSKTGRPPISVRWVDANKGDDPNPNVRSRLVAGELGALDKSGQSTLLRRHSGAFEGSAQPGHFQDRQPPARLEPSVSEQAAGELR